MVERGQPRAGSDTVATEEPLEIRLRATGLSTRKGSLPILGQKEPPLGQRTVAITMRTPGADFELAAGFLHGEGVLRRREDVAKIDYCPGPELDEERRYNIVNVELRGNVVPEIESLERHFLTTSACGVCGKASLEALRIRGCPTVAPGPEVDPDLLSSLPEKLRDGQSVFTATGGLHAAALFDASGRRLAVREDVGRHNAVDKLIGLALLEGWLPLSRHIVMVSGRTSFEILQKCAMAGVPILCAVSAPSSLAVSLAREFGMTLVGFLRGERFNVYAGFERIRTTVPAVP